MATYQGTNVPRTHFVDLDRRYQEANWVSEFQRLWSIFNHWLSSEVGHGQDRQCVETLKGRSELSDYLKRVRQRSASKRPRTNSEGFGGALWHFSRDNELSRFFRRVELSSVLEPRINWPWRVGTEPRRVKQTNAITLDTKGLEQAYRAHGCIMQRDLTYNGVLHEVLESLGVLSMGCCYYRGSPPSVPIIASNKAAALLVEFQNKPSLKHLVELANSTTLTNLESDVIETLYSLRNCAMHGSLDFLNEADNAAARSGYDLLDSLIRDIRTHW